METVEACGQRQTHTVKTTDAGKCFAADHRDGNSAVRAVWREDEKSTRFTVTIRTSPLPYLFRTVEASQKEE